MNQTLWIVYEVIINIYQGALTVIFLNRVLPSKTSNKWPGLVFATLFALLLSSYLVIALPLVDTWVFSIPIIYSLLFLKGPVQSKILWNTLLYMSFIGVINFIYLLFSVFGFTFEELNTYGTLRFFALPVFNLAIGITLHLISYHRPANFDRPFPVLLFVLINIIASLSIDFFWSLYDNKSVSEQTVFLFSSMSYILTLATYMIYRMMSQYAQRDLEQKHQEARGTTFGRTEEHLCFPPQSAS